MLTLSENKQWIYNQFLTPIKLFVYIFERDQTVSNVSKHQYLHFANINIHACQLKQTVFKNCKEYQL